MKLFIKLTTQLVLASTILFSGCKKGADGVNGKDGSSNVKATTYSVSSWSSNSARWYTQLSVPELTADNINSAAILVYIGTNPNNWLSIPSTVVNTTNYFWSFVSSVNLIEVRWEYNGIGIGNNPNSYYSATVQIKVVVIPQAMRIKNQM